MVATAARAAPTQAAPDVSARFSAQLLSACQDTDYQVRIAAAHQLPALARALGASAAVARVLPELAELLQDDEVQVCVTPRAHHHHILGARAAALCGPFWCMLRERQ